MNSIDAIYKFGNLYDRKTRKRILIKDGREISIVLNDGDLSPDDPNIKQQPVLLNSMQKRQEIFNHLGNTKKWKLFDSGKLLYFQITAGIKRDYGIEPVHCKFQVRLLEDLYIYNKRNEVKYARFYDCHCHVEKCLTEFDYFEDLNATSLNDAYTKTYELYFAMFGKSTCNAFDRFFENTALQEPIRSKTEQLQKEAVVERYDLL